MLKFTMYVDHNHDGNAEVIYPKIHEEHEVPTSHEGRLEWIRNSCENLLERIKERERLLSRY